jgi:hypothetical protein
LLIAGIMHSIAAIVSEHVWATLPMWPVPAVRQAAELAAGMSIVGCVFVIVQMLLFFEELWWRP